MKRSGISILRLMGAILVIGVCFVSLRLANEAWAGVIVLGTFAALCVPALGVAYRREARRAFWLGFAVLGWAYLILGTNSVRVITTVTIKKRASQSKSEMIPQKWITGFLLEEMYPYVHPMRGASEDSSYFASLLGQSDPHNRPILKKLEMPIAMPFDAETSLEDVLKYLKMATTDASLPQGIPIYIDPNGLTDAEKTMQSPVTLEIDGVPLRRSLEMLLKPLDLTYEVRDGLLTVTYADGSLSNAMERAAFLQIGHCWFAVLAGIFGGMLGRWFFRTQGAGGVPVSPA